MDNSDNTEPQANAESLTESSSEVTASDVPVETKVTDTEGPTPAAVEAKETASPELNKGPDSISRPSEPVTPPPVRAEKKRSKTPILVILVVLIIMVAAGLGGYMFGKSKGKSSQSVTTSKADQSQEKDIAIPEGATVIAQCAKNRGMQYALPKDIPLGPVYNVYEGKVIGIEYMVGKDDLLGAAKNYLNLPLNNVKYDHVNIGLLSQGHAGFPLPHYHVDIMVVPTSVTDKITCT